MNINLQSKNIEITPAIHDYVVKKVTNLGKILSKLEEEGEVGVYFEVGKSTQHHKSGEYFHADCSVQAKGENFYASADKEDLYEAIDEVKEELFRQIRKNKNRNQALFRRGATKIKNLMKGFRPWK